MSNYKRLTQPTSVLIKQGAVIAIAVYCAVTLLPFIKYKSASTPRTSPSANMSRSLIAVDGLNPAETSSTTWLPNVADGKVQRVNYQISDHISEQTSDQTRSDRSARASAASSENNAHVNLKFIPKICRQPSIPERSISPESEAKTIQEINSWIVCHNTWSNEIQQQLAEASNVASATPAVLQLKRVLLQLQDDDQIHVERISRSYAEWKKNSLSYKQRLGFRRSLMSDADTVKAE